MVEGNWIVSQIGAREHFAVPRGFQQLGRLRLLFTDIWCSSAHSLLKKGPRPVRALAGRYHPHIPGNKVVSFGLHALWRELTNSSAGTTSDKFLGYKATGEWFATRVARSLARLPLCPDRDSFIGFNTGCLETQRLLADRGILTIVDQIDPGRVEEELVCQESERWPGWQELPGRIPDAYFERLAQEWQLADLVLVNSRWSRDALMKQGVSAEKIIVVALAYEPESLCVRPVASSTGPLRVLWLGQVNLRKGIQYLIAAARLLKDTNVHFTIAGGLHISRQAVATAPSNMSFIGQVTRDRLHEVYGNADVFVLPTLSDGFAITQLEALSFGLPVITTPNCGEVVTDGVDGLIVPPASAELLASAIAGLEADRSLVRAMSEAATRKATRFRLPLQARQIERSALEYRRGGRGDKLQKAIDEVRL